MSEWTQFGLSIVLRTVAQPTTLLGDLCLLAFYAGERKRQGNVTSENGMPSHL